MDTKWIRAHGVVWEELDGAALLVSPDSGACWSLNATAAALWKLCDGSRSPRELAAALGKSAREARVEIADFCQTFAKLGLLQPANAPVLVSKNVVMRGVEDAPAFRVLGLGQGPRRRPSPRGNSGPG
jgi:hypothetical protein